MHAGLEQELKQALATLVYLVWHQWPQRYRLGHMVCRTPVPLETHADAQLLGGSYLKNGATDFFTGSGASLNLVAAIALSIYSGPAPTATVTPSAYVAPSYTTTSTSSSSASVSPTSTTSSSSSTGSSIATVTYTTVSYATATQTSFVTQTLTTTGTATTTLISTYQTTVISTQVSTLNLTYTTSYVTTTTQVTTLPGESQSLHNVGRRRRHVGKLLTAWCSMSSKGSLLQTSGSRTGLGLVWATRREPCCVPRETGT